MGAFLGLFSNDWYNIPLYSDFKKGLRNHSYASNKWKANWKVSYSKSTCNCMPLTTFKSLVANMFEFVPNIMECNVFHHIHAKMKMTEPLSKRYFKTEKFCFFPSCKIKNTLHFVVHFIPSKERHAWPIWHQFNIAPKKSNFISRKSLVSVSEGREE